MGKSGGGSQAEAEDQPGGAAGPVVRPTGSLPTTGISDIRGTAANAERITTALARVTLTQSEYDLLLAEEIGEVVGKSPRAVKRFINLYRILRARREGGDLSRFIGEAGHSPLFPAAVFQLAIETGQSMETARTLREIIDELGRDRFVGQRPMDLFDEKNAASEVDELRKFLSENTKIENAWRRCAGIYKGREVALPLIEDWVSISSEVRRYSFNRLNN
jgi:hypothetical protein